MLCFLTLGVYFTEGSTPIWSHPVNIETGGTGVSSDVWVNGWAFISKTPVVGAVEVVGVVVVVVVVGNVVCRNAS